MIWLPFSRLGVVLEHLYAEREDKDGEKGFARCFQMAVRYSF